jgi:serine protease AprX
MSKQWMLLLIAALLLSIAGGGSLPTTAAISQLPWQDKVDPWVIETAQTEGQVEFLVYLAEQADLSQAAQLTTKEAKGAYVYEQLTAMAERTQGPLLEELRRLGLGHRAYWVANLVWVRGDLGAVQRLAARPDVAHLYANPRVQVELPEQLQPLPELLSPEAIEWNILHVNADDVWALGYNGQGVIVGGQDTGYQWNHPALINAYRGWNGATADHNYNWHDAIHGGTNNPTCGFDSPVPCDDNGHGTHTMGTMIGDDGGSNQVGMAPGAQWIGCRNMNLGWGTPQTYTECYQWFIAPTDLNGENPDLSKAPHVINNSWGCPPAEGCTDPNVLLSVVQNVRAAGILTAHSAGNSGPSCSTVNTPSAIYDESFTVGSTTSTDAISSFSSRGPVTIDGSGRLKPDITAPGSSIRSSRPTNTYGISSGTSMAGPHVAGLVALLISANPALAGQVDALEQIITSTAVPLTTTQNCGDVHGARVPNNTFGWGRIDALAAVNKARTLGIAITTSTQGVYPGDALTYTIELTHYHRDLSTTNVNLIAVLPAGTTFVSASDPYTLDNGAVNWAWAELGAGATVSVELTVLVDSDASGSVVLDDYSAWSDEVEAVSGFPITTTILTPTLLLSKTASANLVAPGETLTYTLTVSNPELDYTWTGLVLSDALPVGVAFVDATPPYTFEQGVVTWELATLPGGASWLVELVVQVDEGVTGTVVNATYSVQGALGEPFVGEPVTVAVLPAEHPVIYLPVIPR